MGCVCSKQLSGLTIGPLSANIQPLDIILFRGNQDIVSDGIRDAEGIVQGNNEWSHVGIVISKRWCPAINLPDNIDQDRLLLWESNVSSSCAIITKDPTLDIETGHGFLGVQIRDLASVITYNKKLGVIIGHGQLLHNPIKQLNDECIVTYESRSRSLKRVLSLLHDKYIHRCYQLNCCRLAEAIFPCIQRLMCKCCPGKHFMYCSELVAEIYKHLDILSNVYDAKAVSPVEISELKYILMPPVII